MIYLKYLYIFILAFYACPQPYANIVAGQTYIIQLKWQNVNQGLDIERYIRLRRYCIY